MKAISLSSISVLRAVISGFAGTMALLSYASEPQVEFDHKNKTARFKFTEIRTDVLDISVDTSKVWKAPEQDVYYFKARDINGDIKDGSFLPVATIPSSQLVSQEKVSAVVSQPAVADRMMHEATLSAYDSFTRVTRSILSGRIPAAALSGVPSHHPGNIPASHLMVQGNQEPMPEVDYLGQEEEEDYDTFYSYSEAVTEGARAFVAGEWFGITQVYGHFLDQKQVDQMAGFKSNGYGVQAALLRPVSDEWLLGIYGGWQKLSADLKDINGTVEAGTWRVGPTLAWRRGAMHGEGLLTYSWNTIDNKSMGYKADYKSQQWDVYLRGGYDIDLNATSSGLSLTPEAQLLYVHQKRDDFNWLTQMVKNGKTSGWVSRLGATLNYERIQFSQPFELKLSLGWQHSDLKTADLEISGHQKKYASYDQNGAYYSAGLDTFLNDRLNLNLGYGGVWSKNALSHHIQAGLEFRF